MRGGNSPIDEEFWELNPPRHISWIFLLKLPPATFIHLVFNPPHPPQDRKWNGPLPNNDNGTIEQTTMTLVII